MRLMAAGTKECRLAATVLMAIVLTPALADEPDQQEAFKAAYSAYQEHVENQDFKRAVPEAKAAYEIGRPLFGEDHENTAALAYNYGDVLLETRETAEAKKVLQQAVKFYQRVYGKDSAELIPVLMDLGTAKARLGSSEGQKSEYDRALKLARTHYGSESVRYGRLLLEAGTMILNESQSPFARSYLEKAFQNLSDSLGKDNPTTGLAAFQMARFEFSTRHYKEAEAYLLAALRTFEDPDRPSSMIEMSTHAWLVSVYEELGESEKATAHCQAIGRMTAANDDQEYLPLFRRAPRYPLNAQRQGREGIVDVSFTVDHEGFVREPKVVKGTLIFKSAALDAVKTWRYAPRFVDGEPVATPDVRTRLTFQFAD